MLLPVNHSIEASHRFLWLKWHNFQKFLLIAQKLLLMQ